MRHVSILLCLFIAACAGIEQRPAPVGAIGDAFALTGRVSVKYGGEAASGKFSWEHEPGRDDMLISNPLGQGVARILRSDAVASLTTAGRETYEARDVESLTQKVLGWRLPLEGLPDWVRGRADAGVPAQVRRDGAGRVTELRQAGWLVEFLDYNGSGLPARLRLSREDVEIRLAIDQWRKLP